MSNEVIRIWFVVFLVTQFYHMIIAAPVIMDGMILGGGFIAMAYLTYEFIHAYKEAK